MLNFRGKEPKTRDERELEKVLYDIQKAIQDVKIGDFREAIRGLMLIEPLKSHYSAIDEKISKAREYYHKGILTADDEHQKQQIEIKLAELDEIKVHLEQNYMSDLAVLRAKLIA